jgi:hypothetical protein
MSRSSATDTQMWAVAVILFPVGLLIVWRAHRALLRLKKYEFEHRTAAGVQFETFGDSRKHERKRARAGCAASFGIFLIVIAAVIFGLSTGR